MERIPVPTVDELHVGVDVGSAASASGNDGVCHNRDRFITLFERAMGGDHEAERYFGLVEQG